MIMTTMGSAYWPQTLEGRVLCVLLLIDREANRPEAHVADRRSIETIQNDIAALRTMLEQRD